MVVRKTILNINLIGINVPAWYVLLWTAGIPADRLFCPAFGCRQRVTVSTRVQGRRSSWRLKAGEIDACDISFTPEPP